MEAVWRAGLRTRRGGSRGSPASVLVLAGVNAVPAARPAAGYDGLLARYAVQHPAQAGVITDGSRL